MTSRGQTQAVTYWKREGKQKQRKSCQETTVWWVLLQEPRPPPRWRMVTSDWTWSIRPQTGWNQKVDDWDSQNVIALPSPPTNQKKIHKWQPSQQMLPLQTFPWLSSGSLSLLRTSCQFFLLGACNKHYFHSLQPNVSRLALLHVGKQNHVWLSIRLFTHIKLLNSKNNSVR